MSDCTHDCSTCGESCSSRTAEQDMHEHLNELSSVKHTIAVVSGKGGVGKSLVTSLTAVLLSRLDYHVAILDADITGPSIPKMFGLNERAEGDGQYIYPVRTKTGIDVMSINLLLDSNTDPVVWRGPVIAGAVKQFYSEVIWKDVDFMLVDMPPGTGDVPLTVFQSLPVDGIIVVTSPQDLVSMIVSKAVKMANMMNIPVLGLVENMSYYRCPDCGKEHKIYGDSHIESIAKTYGLPVLARMPIDPTLASGCDKGLTELFEGDFMNGVVARCEQLAQNDK